MAVAVTTPVTLIDLSLYTEARLVVTIGADAGASSARLSIRALDHYVTSPGDYLPIGPGGGDIGVPIDGSTGDSCQDSAWQSIDAAFLGGEFYVAIIGHDADDASSSPIFGMVTAYFR